MVCIYGNSSQKSTLVAQRGSGGFPPVSPRSDARSLRLSLESLPFESKIAFPQTFHRIDVVKETNNRDRAA